MVVDAAPFRATLAAFFTISGLLGTALLAASGQFTREAALQALAAVPALGAGLFAGERLYRAVDERLFRRLVLAVLVASSALALTAVFAA